MHWAESRALATVLLQRASGRRRRREEGVACNNGSRPSSFDNKRVDTLLHHLGYRLWLWALTFGYLPCPVPPPPPCSGEGRNSMRGIIIIFAVAAGITRRWNIPAHHRR